jgi:hypothetical protein
LLVKRARDRVSDPAGRSGDERSLSGQIEHLSRSFVEPRLLRQRSGGIAVLFTRRRVKQAVVRRVDDRASHRKHITCCTPTVAPSPHREAPGRKR